MTRIIAGVVGGRRLLTPRGAATRPTSDRVREALFSTLTSRDVIPGARVLDAYAGSGALGLEAASRGASQVTLVESDRATARLISRNAADLALPGLEVRATSVRAFAAEPGRAAYDLVLADPPYPMTEPDLAADLAALAGAGLFAPHVLIVLERATRSPEPTWPPGFIAEKPRRYGETTLWFAGPA